MFSLFKHSFYFTIVVMSDLFVYRNDYLTRAVLGF